MLETYACTSSGRSARRHTGEVAKIIKVFSGGIRERSGLEDPGLGRRIP